MILSICRRGSALQEYTGSNPACRTPLAQDDFREVLQARLRSRLTRHGYQNRYSNMDRAQLLRLEYRMQANIHPGALWTGKCKLT